MASWCVTAAEQDVQLPPDALRPCFAVLPGVVLPQMAVGYVRDTRAPLEQPQPAHVISLSCDVQFVYPMGKIVFGYIADRFGGRITLFACIVGTAAASAVFSTGRGFLFFMMMWAALRSFQPAGWIGLVKIAGAWVPWQRQGRVMAVLSLSMMAGDVIARSSLAGMLGFGWTWRGLILVASFLTVWIVLPAALILRDSPTDRGLPALPPNPESVFKKGKKGAPVDAGGVELTATPGTAVADGGDVEEHVAPSGPSSSDKRTCRRCAGGS